MAADWNSPCARTTSGEDAWCTLHLGELVGADRRRVSQKIVRLGGFDDVGKRLDCEERTRGRVVPLGTIVTEDLDLIGAWGVVTPA